MIKKMAFLLLTLAMIFTLMACNKSDTPANTAEPVEITVATILMPNTLDTLTEQHIAGYNIVYYHVYDRLVNLDTATGEWLPAVAKSWELVNDTTWKFEINMDYKFSNGDPLTMDDIVYSFERIKDNPNNKTTGDLIEKVSYEGTTLTLVVADTAVNVPTRILSVAIIVNKSYIENGGIDALNNKPVGTGPYAVTEFTSGSSATLEYWDGYPFEKPQIDKINYMQIAELSSRYVALETGLAQMADDLSAYEMDMAKEAGFTTSVTKLRRTQVFWFNCENPPFDNSNIRRALGYALNRDGFCALSGGRIPDKVMAFGGYDNLEYESGNIPEFDLDKARELLEAEGYNTSNPLRLSVKAIRGDPGVEMYQSDLRSIGVELEISVLEFSLWLADMLSGNFDIIFIAYPNLYNHALSDLDRFDANCIPDNNETRFTNKRAQELVDQMRYMHDEQALKPLAVELSDVVSQEMPYIPIFRLTANYAFDSRLTGVMIDRSLGVYSFHHATFSS